MKRLNSLQNQLDKILKKTPTIRKRRIRRRTSSKNKKQIEIDPMFLEKQYQSDLTNIQV